MEVYQTIFQLAERDKHIGKAISNEHSDVLNIQLKKGQSVAKHNAKERVLIVVRSGRVLFTVEDQPFELTSEQLLWMEPLENHSIEALEDSDFIVVKLK